ncbi:MAG: alkaline phosphatase family protein [Sporolactobacillus sp.]
MPSNKLIMVTLDGCRYDTAVDELGFLGHLVEKGRAARFRVKSELPSNSRPLYQVLLTGTPPCENGIVSNLSIRLSAQNSLFHLVRQAGGRTAAVAYHWVSELYQQAPFSYQHDRIQHQLEKPIQHGMFYFEDQYPDSHVFAEANYLLETYQPDFLYIHSMNIDDIGHKFTAASAEYRAVVGKVDIILAECLPAWLEAGYQIIVTADQGMDEFGHHGGTRSGVRDVPLFILSEKVATGISAQQIPQLMVAPLACHLMGIMPSDDMQTFDESLFDGEREKGAARSESIDD